MLGYGAGLRVSEVVTVRVEELSFARRMVKVRRGKGRKDRYSLLSPVMIRTLRAYLTRDRIEAGWVFPGRDRSRQVWVETAKDSSFGIHSISARCLRSRLATWV